MFINIVYFIIDFIILILLLKLKSENPTFITFFFGFLDFIEVFFL
jgi:hypothetical protein